VRPTSSSGLHSIEFLIHLGRLAGDRLLVIGDGSPIHRRAWVREFVEETGDKIHREPPPPYAPHLDPVEWLWRHLNLVEMANRTCLDLEQLHEELHRVLGRVCEKRRLVPSFFEGAGMALRDFSFLCNAQ
jgi:transposase